MRRRSRFTVEFADGSRTVILAYGALDAEHYFRARGREVVDTVSGDYRISRSSGGYRINQAALNAAIATLGLKIPVRVRFHARAGSTRGNYRFAPTHHNIMLKSYLTPEQASNTLWHELTHALQAERSGSVTGWAAECNKQKRYSYRNRPIEREANAMADKMSHRPLCR